MNDSDDELSESGCCRVVAQFWKMYQPVRLPVQGPFRDLDPTTSSNDGRQLNGV